MTHIVTVTVDQDGLRESVKFTCDGTPESECHIYPDSENWHDDDGQKRLTHEKCWLQDWFDSDAYTYFGPDSLDDCGELGVPHIARSGEIEFEFEPEDGPTWWWKGSRR